MMSHSDNKRNREDLLTANKRAKLEEPSYAFLETIDERKLDFDLEKRCNITLSPLNCYCCLICGKYLRGRRENTPVFLHSVNEDHHVFINFNSLKVYLLPENVEVEDKDKIQVLVRIRNAIRPTFSREEVNNFPHECIDLSGQKYTNGFIGFNNNASGNDSINVVLLLISHLTSLRNYFLLEEYVGEDEVVKRLRIIIRKLWSTRLFRPHVSSEEFLAFISVVEPKLLNNINDPRQIFIWLLNNLAKKSSHLKKILHESSQGVVRVTSTPIKPLLDSKGDLVRFQKDTVNEKTSTVPYFLLTLDLPPTPLFKDSRNANDLPQVRIEDLLKKFDGNRVQDSAHGLKKFKLIRLPKYLVLHFNRFDKKSPLPVKNRNQTLIEFSQTLTLQDSKYTLITNVVHEIIRSAVVEEDDKSSWKIQYLNSKNDQWVELDGTINRLKEKELLFLQESYMQVWQKEGT